jgi:hypothetical protein
MVQLSELAGRKYLQSAHPLMPSFYGTNSRTLVLAPEAILRPLIETSAQPKTGPLLDRVREVPSGYDLYAAVDVASLRPMIQMARGAMPATVPAEAKAMLEVPNLIATLEFTLNMSAPGPTSLVLHASDDTAAEQLEKLFAGENIGDLTPQALAIAMNDPITVAMHHYKQRMKSLFRQQRNGATLTCFHIDGNNPAQQQVVSAAVVGLSLLPSILDAAKAAQQAKAAAAPAQPPTAQPAEQSPPPGPGL